MKGTHPVKNAATKRAAALETVPRTRTRMNMDPEVKQVGGADAGEEEGGVEASGDQVKRKREVDESDEEEVTEQKVEKEDGDEGDSESSGEDAYAFESVEVFYGFFFSLLFRRSGAKTGRPSFWKRPRLQKRSRRSHGLIA